MNPSSDKHRLEWLDAGRALGDLTPDELREWRALSAKLGARPQNPSFDDLTDALDRGFADQADLPKGLEEALHHSVPVESPMPSERPPNVLTTLFRNAPIAWGIAALLAMGLWLDVTVLEPNVPSVEQRVAEAGDRIALPLTAVGDTNTLLGAIVWSDTLQEGYMELSGISPNNPSESQYQLWIVDPARDARPVDGGVFDVPNSEALSVQVPIDARLPVRRPTNFVITLEKPGGVVVSDQERVIAVATL